MERSCGVDVSYRRWLNLAVAKLLGKLGNIDPCHTTCHTYLIQKLEIISNKLS